MGRIRNFLDNVGNPDAWREVVEVKDRYYRENRVGEPKTEEPAVKTNGHAVSTYDVAAEMRAAKVPERDKIEPYFV